MESNERPEVTIRRRQQGAPGSEAPYMSPEADSARSREISPAVAPESDDDVAVSSEQPGGADRRISEPSYGEMGAPPGLATGADLEPAGGYRPGLAMPRPHAAGAEADLLLDSWYATFGHPAITGLMRRPEMIQTIADLTGETDDRVRIAQTEAYPWRCICALHIIAADGSGWLGTGWLAGPRVVITAGHCVYMHRRGGWVRQIEVIPGADGDQRPYGAAVASSFRSVRGWVLRQNHGCDYGAVVLPADRAFGNLLGYLGFASLGDLDLESVGANLVGYPCDKPPGTQWYHARRIERVTPRALAYRVDSAGGHSGAPIWCIKNGQRLVVGIHAGGDVSGNAATRINTPTFDNIRQWKREGSE